MDERCFVCGPENEKGLRIEFVYEDNKAQADYILPEYFQGYTDVVHGGIVSTLLDEVMAKACGFNGYNAYTVELNIRFRKSLPVGTQVHISGEVTEKRHKLIKTKAEVRSEDEIFATAQARFFEF